MSRYIDADKLIELCEMMADKCDGIGESVWNQFATTVDWSPTVDAVPVVRCKDCKYISATTIGMKYACWKGASQVWGKTGDHAGDYVCRRIDDPEFFCADGEAKE